jgi:hypothetical protein
MGIGPFQPFHPLRYVPDVKLRTGRFKSSKFKSSGKVSEGTFHVSGILETSKYNQPELGDNSFEHDICPLP